MGQIIFNTISAAEISALPKLQQLDLLAEFKVNPEELKKPENLDGERFGVLEREGKTLYRYRANDMRIYFSCEGDAVVVHRVLHRNTFQDFMYRGGMPVAEDDALARSTSFWALIEEGQNADRVQA